VVWMVIGAITLLATIVVDNWRPKGAGDGLMTTLTVATFLSIIVFRASAVAEPGFPQLVIAALVGTLLGALVASILWRLIQPIRKYLPARP